MPTHSLFPEYKGVYLAFLRALSHTQLVNAIATHSLTAFPTRLPSELKDAVASLFNWMGNAMLSAIDEDPPNDGRADLEPTLAEPSLSSDPEALRFAECAIELMLAEYRPGASGDADVQAVARHQAVAMMFAHLDAFFGDSVRIICRVRPEVLRNNKQITWTTVLDFDRIDRLVEHIIEQYVYEFGWKTVDDRIRTLINRFGLELDVPDADLAHVRTLEQKRHLIIHNGGVVTSKYTRESGDCSTPVGQVLAVSAEDVQLLYDAVKMIGSDLCAEVARKLLGAEDIDLTQIWRRKSRSADGAR